MDLLSVLLTTSGTSIRIKEAKLFRDSLDGLSGRNLAAAKAELALVDLGCLARSRTAIDWNVAFLCVFLCLFHAIE
jgi:hypothetical protein